MNTRHLAGWIGLGTLVVIVIVTFSGPLVAQQKGETATKEAGRGTMEAMARHARSIRVNRVGESADTRPIPLRPEPILRYDDKPRDITDATLWAWGEKGRPLAILKTEDYLRRTPELRWSYGITSLSDGLILVEGDEDWSWSSSRPGLEFRDVPRAPVPAGSEALRLGQMKEIARRFEAHVDAGPPRGRLQLRLLPRPIDRYADPGAGIQDGAIFAYAYGTNPDLLLAVEAHRGEDPSPKWRYGLARMGGSATFASLDGQEIWTQPRVPGPARAETYMNRRQRDRSEP